MAKKKAVKKARRVFKEMDEATAQKVFDNLQTVKLINENEKLQKDLLLVSEEVARLNNENAGLRAHVEQLLADVNESNADARDSVKLAESLHQQVESLERQNEDCNVDLGQWKRALQQALSVAENLSKTMVE